MLTETLANLGWLLPYAGLFGWVVYLNRQVREAREAYAHLAVQTSIAFRAVYRSLEALGADEFAREINEKVAEDLTFMRHEIDLNNGGNRGWVSRLLSCLRVFWSERSSRRSQDSETDSPSVCESPS